MKLINRKNIQVGQINIQYGHKPYLDDRTGDELASSLFYAECGYNGQRYSQPLKTRNEAMAIHRIHEWVERILAGEGAAPAKVTFTDLIRRYLASQHSMVRAKTTLTKYEYVLATFLAWTNTH